MVRAVLPFFHDMKLTVQRWHADDGLLMASATAYYLGISFFPLLLVLIAGLGVFLESTNLGQDAQQRVLDAISQNASSQLAEFVEAALSTVKRHSARSGPVGLLAMLVTSLAAFAQLDAAFDRVWNVPPKPAAHFLVTVWHLIVDRGRAFLLLLALGLIIVTVFIAGLAFSAISAHTVELLPLSKWASSGMQTALTFAINVVVFTLMHKLLPKIYVGWSEALWGGLFTAVAWELGRQILTQYTARSEYASAYGVIGAFLGVLLWCYYAVIIVLLGAEWMRVRRERRQQKMSQRAL